MTIGSDIQSSDTIKKAGGGLGTQMENLNKVVINEVKSARTTVLELEIRIANQSIEAKRKNMMLDF